MTGALLFKNPRLLLLLIGVIAVAMRISPSAPALARRSPRGSKAPPTIGAAWAQLAAWEFTTPGFGFKGLSPLKIGLTR